MLIAEATDTNFKRILRLSSRLLLIKLWVNVSAFENSLFSFSTICICLLDFCKFLFSFPVGRSLLVTFLMAFMIPYGLLNTKRYYDICLVN